MEPVVLSPGIGDGRPTATLYYGQDVRETLRTLPEASVHTVCTSPPYWGLRDYGTGDAQIGLEDSPEEFVAALVEVFREVKRVLRPDGTLWVNLGDSYWGGKGKSSFGMVQEAGDRGVISKPHHNAVGGHGKTRPQDGRHDTIKPKDLVGIPWRVAFALQADGWYLRQDIIWSKSNPMPESVSDRCTKAHEYVFLLSKSARYWYDAEAVKESSSENSHGGGVAHAGRYMQQSGRNDGKSAMGIVTTTRNKRSVWNVNPRHYSGAHFAVWPPELVRPMILAGCPVGGTVLDPFSGSATTGMVALREGRNYVGCDLNPDYLPLAVNRIQDLPAPQPDAPVEEGSNVFDLFSDG